jgi:hypothetical protein
MKKYKIKDNDLAFKLGTDLFIGFSNVAGVVGLSFTAGLLNTLIKLHVFTNWLNVRIQKEFFHFLKDVTDTFKPYKTTRQVLRDLFLQPLKGIWNVIRAVGIGLLLGVVAAPAVVIAALTGIPSLLTSLFGYRLPLTENISTTLSTMLASMLAFSVTQLVRGITQIAAWPLTIARAIIPRAIISFIKLAQGTMPKIEHSEGLQEIVAKYENENNFCVTKPIYAQLLVEKFHKAYIVRHQRTSIDPNKNLDVVRDMDAYMNNKPNAPTAISVANSLFPILKEACAKQADDNAERLVKGANFSA